MLCAHDDPSQPCSVDGGWNGKATQRRPFICVSKMDLVESETDDCQAHDNMEKVVRGAVEEESEGGTLERMSSDTKNDLN